MCDGGKCVTDCRVVDLFCFRLNPQTPECNVQTGKCQKCTSNSACSSLKFKTVCDLSSFSTSGQCVVPCIGSINMNGINPCTLTSPVCDPTNNCVNCKTGADCSRFNPVNPPWYNRYNFRCNFKGACVPYYPGVLNSLSPNFDNLIFYFVIIIIFGDYTISAPKKLK